MDSLIDYANMSDSDFSKLLDKLTKEGVLTDRIWAKFPYMLPIGLHTRIRKNLRENAKGESR